MILAAFFQRTDGIESHPLPQKQDIVADEKDVPEKKKDETWRVAPDMECLDAQLSKIFCKGYIERKGNAACCGQSQVYEMRHAKKPCILRLA